MSSLYIKTRQIVFKCWSIPLGKIQNWLCSDFFEDLLIRGKSITLVQALRKTFFITSTSRNSTIDTSIEIFATFLGYVQK